MPAHYTNPARMAAYGWPPHHTPPAPFTMCSGMAGPFAMAPLARKGHSIIVHRGCQVFAHTPQGWVPLGAMGTLANAYAFANHVLHNQPTARLYRAAYTALAVGWPGCAPIATTKAPTV